MADVTPNAPQSKIDALGATTPLVPHPTPPAEPIYKGNVSHWVGIKSYALAVLSALCGAVLLVVWAVFFVVPWALIAMIGGFALLLASLAMIVYVSLYIRSIRYTITTRLIEREMGLVVTKVDALDLARVKHVDLKQTFLERVVNVGTIEVFSVDNEEALLLIDGLPDPRPIYEKLRDAVIEINRHRGIIVQ